MLPAGTILIVEHDLAIRELIVELLTDEGYRTCAAATGRVGLAVIVADRPALTLFDMALPDLTAEELLRQLRASGLADVRLVLMSTIPRFAAPLLVPGSIDCLAKPFDIDTVIDLAARYTAPLLAAG